LRGTTLQLDTRQQCEPIATSRTQLQESTRIPLRSGEVILRQLHLRQCEYRVKVMVVQGEGLNEVFFCLHHFSAQERKHAQIVSCRRETRVEIERFPEVRRRFVQLMSPGKFECPL